ncbi:MAG: GNAT family N-acetyltransferase [Rickettsiales bacterium]|nr:GNAT family N-acetyltransferase [Rickettsiales bacterium]
MKDGELELRQFAPTLEVAATYFAGAEKDRIKLVCARFNSAKDVYEWLKPYGDNKRLYGIFVKGENAGFVGLANRSTKAARKIEMLYYLLKKFEGFGHMSRAFKMLERELFGKLGIEKIIITFAEGNKRSLNTAMRNGYKIESAFRDGNEIFYRAGKT